MTKNRMTSTPAAIHGAGFPEPGLVPYEPGVVSDENTEAERIYSIGDLAREFGVTLRTLRFYEDRGMISPHRQGTTRLYSTRDKARLALILKGKKLGFTLGELRDLLANDEATCGGMPAELKLSIDQVDEQIAHLLRQKSEVETAILELTSTRHRLAAKSVAA